MAAVWRRVQEAAGDRFRASSSVVTLAEYSVGGASPSTVIVGIAGH